MELPKSWGVGHPRPNSGVFGHPRHLQWLLAAPIVIRGCSKQRKWPSKTKDIGNVTGRRLTHDFLLVVGLIMSVYRFRGTGISIAHLATKV